MSRRRPSLRKRLTDLLVQRALFGLNERKQRELAALLTKCPSVDSDEFDRIAADFYLACQSGPYEPLPAEVAERIRASWTPPEPQGG